MSKLTRLRSELTALETRRQEILGSGDVITGATLTKAKPSGTASRNAATAYRLRFKEPQANGKRTQYVRQKDVAQTRAALARGKELVKVERAIAKIQNQIDAIAIQIAELGGTVQ